MPSPELPKFFITHSWQDINFASRLSGDLRARGLDGFLDKYSIQVGEDIAARIARGLEDCDVYIPVLSPAALESPWCEREINVAISLSMERERNGRPRIVPVIAKPCQLPVLLRPLRAINFAGRYDQALEELLAGLSAGTLPAPPAKRKISLFPLLPALIGAVVLLGVCLLIAPAIVRGLGWSATPTLIAGSVNTTATIAPARFTAGATNATSTLLTPSSLTSAPIRDQIAFYCCREGHYQIYAMDSSGTNVRQLTNDPAEDKNPTWSPDGKSLAFQATRDGNLEVYAIDADGSNERNLTKNPADDAGPAWSPDGRRIAFTSNRDDPNPRTCGASCHFEIYVTNADGTSPHRLTHDQADDDLAAWSPDGCYIAYTSDLSGRMQIYVMNADGTNSRRLGYSPADDWRPAWSPDGRLIAFISTRLGSQAIYLMNADGTNPRRLSHDSVEDSDPAWSPDGRFIAFRSKSAEGSRYIYVMNADGSNPHQVGNDADAYFPAWWSSQRLPGGHPNCSG